ncbi:transcriptional activator RinB [Staphylococcus delphini]|uniref:transcriptional activator RinB n=1 Tax=Staphylococcus delphini TaxID=53344 RepID=UPI000BBCD794|nr:transcriptional regulator [Staphylococcus delphini]PCF44194.1 transcriptional regulator [Staphylococcus delphini]
MIKRITKLIVTLTAYELIKCLTEQAIVVLTANDEIDTFNECDHIHLNNLRAEVSE